jgi:hypothetical protein
MSPLTKYVQWEKKADKRVMGCPDGAKTGIKTITVTITYKLC